MMCSAGVGSLFIMVILLEATQISILGDLNGSKSLCGIDEVLVEDSLVYIKIWCTSKTKIWYPSVKEFDVNRRRF